jgi:alpha-galactosidase
MPRIVFMGAGSVEFTQTLTSDILAMPDLLDVTFVLHDIDAERLDTADRMVRAMLAQEGSSHRVESYADRREAFAGADYVINTIAVGGIEAVRTDFAIPARYGIRQTIADTLGIGGIFRGLRTIPVMLQIGADMSELCPDAWLLNYTNPMSMLPRAVYEGAGFSKVVGICHSVRNTQQKLAELLGYDEPELAFVTAGVNHQSFVLSLRKDGADLYPRLAEIIEADPHVAGTVRAEIFRNVGYFPTESSEHGSEYLPWFLPHDEEIDRFNIPVDVYLSICDELLGTYEDTRSRLAAGQPIELNGYNELAPQIIHAMETGIPAVVHGNVRNTGLISNLPQDACVEVPCLVDRSGIAPTAIGALPPQLAALNSNFLQVSELVIRAALDGKREHVYHAALVDPHASAVLTTRQSRALVDEMIAAYGDLMPEGVRD